MTVEREFVDELVVDKITEYKMTVIVIFVVKMSDEKWL
jgi:hypothetical protein